MSAKSKLDDGEEKLQGEITKKVEELEFKLSSVWKILLMKEREIVDKEVSHMTKMNRLHKEIERLNGILQSTN